MRCTRASHWRSSPSPNSAALRLPPSPSPSRGGAHGGTRAQLPAAAASALLAAGAAGASGGGGGGGHAAASSPVPASAFGAAAAWPLSRCCAKGLEPPRREEDMELLGSFCNTAAAGADLGAEASLAGGGGRGPKGFRP